MDSLLCALAGDPSERDWLGAHWAIAYQDRFERPRAKGRLTGELSRNLDNGRWGPRRARLLPAGAEGGRAACALLFWSALQPGSMMLVHHHRLPAKASGVTARSRRPSKRRDRRGPHRPLSSCRLQRKLGGPGLTTGIWLAVRLSGSCI